MFRVFTVGKKNTVHDGLPFGHGINVVRARYGSEEEETCFVLYPCDEKNSYAHHGHKLRLSWGLTSVNMAVSTEEKIASQLETEAHDRGGSGGHAVVFIHGGGFVAANAAVLLQEAVTMAREGVSVYSVE